MSGKTFYIRDASKLVNSKKMEDSTLGFRTVNGVLRGGVNDARPSWLRCGGFRDGVESKTLVYWNVGFRLEWCI